MHPLQGVDVDHAIAELRDLARLARNIDNPPPLPGVEGAAARRDEYLAWVDAAEPRLVGIYGVDALPALHNEAYRQIFAMDIYGPRPIALVNNEAARQARRCASLADHLMARRDAFGGGEAIFVVDTNAFMHYRTLNEPRRWRDEALQTSSVVVVPLRVVQELDRKKQSTSNRHQKRATKTLRLLSEVLDGRLVGSVVDGVTVRVVVEDDVYDAQADEEILNVAARVQTYARREVIVLTGDLSMQLRAIARGLLSSEMPTALRLPLDVDDSAPTTAPDVPVT